MTNGDTTWIVKFIWGIADDVLRDLYVRGKYRDVILPMTVLRRLDAILEPTKAVVAATKHRLDDQGIVNQDAALRNAAGYAFYNTSPFSLTDLRNRASQSQLKADFVNWLDGFSPNVQEIISAFGVRNQVSKLSKADALGTLIVKFTDPKLDLSPAELDNHAMGTVFETLVRMFNEENNEEAGEHWTPRDAIALMANLIYRPIADQIQSSTYLLYDPAAGTGGMLTVGEQTLKRLGEQNGKQVVTHLYGQEYNEETHAICKADLLLKGDGEEADNIIGGPEWSTISNDAFPNMTFDFMMANPPYGRSWKVDLERMGGKDNITDPRFLVTHEGEELSLIPRSSDGQLLFTLTMLSKMKDTTELGSRIAVVHNGSALFTGDAGQGESNIRRWIIENDWLETIVQLPNNMFYNTGITTYIWVLTNHKPEHRKGKIQLIDASDIFTPLRKNLGQKNCELTPGNIEQITSLFLDFADSDRSRIFNNDHFGYRKVTVDRPLRLTSRITTGKVNGLLYASGDEALRQELHDSLGDVVFDDPAKAKPQIEAWIKAQTDSSDEDSPVRSISKTQAKKLLNPKTWLRDARLFQVGKHLAAVIGDRSFSNFAEFEEAAKAALDGLDVRLSAAERKVLLRFFSETDENAEPVIRKIHKEGTKPDRLHGLFEADIDGTTRVVEYEHDPDLRDTERVPLEYAGGIATFISDEVLPYTSDAWVSDGDGKVGYEISFTRVFYKPTKLRSLDEIRADIERILAKSDRYVQEALEL